MKEAIDNQARVLSIDSVEHFENDFRTKSVQHR